MLNNGVFLDFFLFFDFGWKPLRERTICQCEGLFNDDDDEEAPGDDDEEETTTTEGDEEAIFGFSFKVFVVGSELFTIRWLLVLLLVLEMLSEEEIS